MQQNDGLVFYFSLAFWEVFDSRIIVGEVDLANVMNCVKKLYRITSLLYFLRKVGQLRGIR